MDSKNTANDQTFKNVLLGLLIVAIILTTLCVLLSFLINNVSFGLLAFFDRLTTLDATVVVALITGCISILTVVGGSVINSLLQARREKQGYLRKHREEPYTRLIEIYYKMLKASKGSGGYPQDEMLEDIIQFSQELTLWGSSKAIKRWVDWRLLGAKHQIDQREVLRATEDVLIQLRKDMGQRGGLKQGDLLKMFINNYDESIQKKE